MEEKKRITLRIAGQVLSIVTDDEEETVRAIEKELDERISEFGRRIPRMATKEGRMSAVILCAVEAMSRERALEQQLLQASAAAAESPDRTESESGNGAAWEAKYRALLGDYEKLAARCDALLASEKAPGTGRGADADEKRETAKELLLAKKARL